LAATPIELAVVGAHLRGQPLNHQLTDRGGTFVAATTTAASYRLYALATEPPKPGLVRAPGDPTAGAVEVEVWALAPAAFGEFVAAVPAPLSIGRVLLADGRDVAGFLCEPFATVGAEEITRFGGWRAYLATRQDRH
jgi:allophanate hydrolase